MENEKLTQYTFTPNTASKKLQFLNQDKDLLFKEEYSLAHYTYLSSDEAETLIDPYNFKEYSSQYFTICDNILRINIALKNFNAQNIGPKTGYTIQEILVLLPMYSKRKFFYEELLRNSTKTRRTVGTVSEYRVPNFNPSEVQEEYKTICQKISDLQEDLNVVNSTHTFTVELNK